MKISNKVYIIFRHSPIGTCDATIVTVKSKMAKATKFVNKHNDCDDGYYYWWKEFDVTLRGKGYAERVILQGTRNEYP